LFGSLHFLAITRSTPFYLFRFRINFDIFDIAMGYRMGDSDSIPDRDKDILSSSQRPDQI
jgi:hypothetical protein